MVTDGDDDQRSEEGFRGEKRCLELLATSLGSYGEEETRSVRVRDEEDSVSTKLGRRKIDDECKNQQNHTTYRHDYASSSSSSSWSLSSVESKKRRVVSQEPINAEPLREVKPSVRGKKPVKRERGVTPEWLDNLMITEKGVDAKLVIDKMIQTSDVNPNQGRLLIPFNQIVEMDFLNEAELHLIDEHQRDNSSNKGVAVIMVASDGRKRNAKLRRWNMNCPNYALCSGWNVVVRENNLKDKVGQIFRLWSFHSQDGKKLYLAFFHQPPALDMAQPQAQDQHLDQAMHADSSSSMTPLDAEQERRDRRTSLESVIETTTTADLELRLGPSVDLNIPLAPVPTEMAALEAVQETSLESVTETTTTVDLELRLWF
ncbi:PREDICTED: B3 domain-containing protein At2g31720 [Brassica oleracea var. oleracea]|uniref:B3 domain-containing protein At2g31720 n=1 Tax=Brassica oleracea var. oleracea TaxID=109376 RepID=UPI0006A721BA|nr:PREDICTED: B3 domain-containing protein At2g31720 [Brassica oleracea var. oleracea]